MDGQIIAKMNPTWAAKFAFIIVILLGYAAWSFYDGMFAYPQQNRRVALYKQAMDSAGAAEWKQIAAENGWSEEDPGDPISQTTLFWQWLAVGICVPAALWLLGVVIITARRRIAADHSTLYGPRNQKVPYTQITSVDMSRWKDKGIAVVHYTDDGGRERKIKLDDWVFRGIAEVLEHLERHAGMELGVKAM